MTSHEASIRGHRVAYDAVVDGITIQDSLKRAIGRIGYIAYTRRNAGDPTTRPIAFIYNGGPGASSATLHLRALGPRRLVTDDTGYLRPPFALEDNPYSLLDETDMVFIDPVGTGYATTITPGTGRNFWGVAEDARSIAQFIDEYLRQTGRGNSPIYLIGESYGTVRSAVLVNVLQKTHSIYVAGIVFISSKLDGNTANESPGNLLPHIFYLPTFAAAARYHHRLPDDRRTLDSLLAEVEKFATTEFASALLRWETLPAQEREHVLAQLERYTGISKNYWEAARLRVGMRDFQRILLQDRDLVLDRYDARITTRAGTSQSDNILSKTITSYLRDELRVEGDLPYVVQGRVSPWNFLFRLAPDGSPTFNNYQIDLAEAMRNDPRIEILLNSGVYDLAAPYFPSQWAMSQMILPDSLRRVHMVRYEGGHMMYTIPTNLVLLTDHIETFIGATSKHRRMAP
jgi:carboxypeptidase C (cathepsin A)